MKRNLILAVLLGGDASLARSASPGPDRRPGGFRARHPDQPSRPRLRRRAVLQHGLRHRSRRQQARSA